MDTWPSTKLFNDLTGENYASTFSAYRFWTEIGAAHEGMSNHQLDNDILGCASRMSSSIITPRVDFGQVMIYDNADRYKPTGQLIHPNIHLLLRFITDAELDPAFSTYAVGLHDRLCRKSLKKFFRQTLDYVSGGPSSQSCEFYTLINLIAHWVNLGYVKLEDVRDRILQSLIFQPTVHPYQLDSLMILLKISGATFAAHVDPSVMTRCCDLLKPSNLSCQTVLWELAEVSAPILKIETGYER